jgi:NADPH:quinone reductase-like Zn-dependent oxidoreductase
MSEVGDDDPTWGGAPIAFPRIQGADVCGRIVAVGHGVDPARIGERVITDNWLRDPDDRSDKDKTGYFGSERDGGFAEYTTIPARNALAMTARFRRGTGDVLLLLFHRRGHADPRGRDPGRHGAGSRCLGRRGRRAGATGQAARRPGDRIGVRGQARRCGRAWAGSPPAPRALEDLRAALEGEKITVVADVVGGPFWPGLIDILERGGRYTCSGAIAGPMVTLDLRTFYLRDLTFTGSTVIDPGGDAEPRPLHRGGRNPARARRDLSAGRAARGAQAAFIEKRHTGNIVVIP